MASSPHQKLSQISLQHKLFIILLLVTISSLVLFLVFAFTPVNHFTNPSSIAIQNNPQWVDFVVSGKFVNKRNIKVGLVNFESLDENLVYRTQSNCIQVSSIGFDRVSESLTWKDFFPAWIHESGPSTCPDIPMPALHKYRDLDVIMVKLSCNNSEVNSNKDVFRLQVNLVAARLAVQSGWSSLDIDRTVYVVFVGSCGPMVEIFRCDDLVQRVGDYWVYKPDMRKLKHKVLMPVGSCQLAPPLAETGEELWRNEISSIDKTIHKQKEAYVTILHSSESYVCGAIALAQSLIQTQSLSIFQSKSKRDLVLLHDNSITPKSLQGLKLFGWKTKLVSRIKNPFAKKGAYNEWNYSKLRIWELIEYDKIIFIDSDLLIFKNIREFFTFPQLSAVSNDKTLFNSGIMVIEPSLCMFEHLMTKINEVEPYNGGDQGFLNEIFTWWHRLPKKLNMLKMFIPSDDKHEIKNIESAFAIHYLGLKPWVCYRDYDCNWDIKNRQVFASDSVHEKWWTVYDKMPERLRGYCGLNKKMNDKILERRGIARDMNLSDGHWKIVPKDPRQFRVF